MTITEEPPTIVEHESMAAALVAALAELTDPTASETANMGTFTSKYAKLSGIMQTIRPTLGRHGLAVVQHVRSNDGELIITTTLRHTSGDVLDSGALSTRMPPNAQQVGSVVTYFRRYQLCALLGIAPDGEDDDDGKAASKTTTAQPKTKTTKRKADDEQPPATTRPVVEITEMQRRHIMAMFNSLGLSGDTWRQARLDYTSNAIGREITTTNEITRDEARVLIEALIADTNEPEPEPDGSYG